MAVGFIIAVACGVVVGMLSGMLGIGGGMVMVPLFRLVFGMSALSSTATSLFTIIPTSVSGAAAHLRARTCVLKLGVALGIGGALTSPLGVQLAQLSPSWTVMLAAALVIGYSAATMLRKALKAPKVSTARAGRAAAAAPGGRTAQAAQVSQAAPAAPAAPSAPAAPAAPSAPASGEEAWSQPHTAADFAKAAGIGALAGVASGYVGLGGGFIMVPLMLSVLGMDMRHASGTSLVAVMILATPATVMQCMLGNVDYLVGIAMACGSIPGAVLGARLASRIPERALRFAFAGFLGLAALLLVVKELGAW